jgi:uncharacterized protein YbjT (DUF2867 family)
MTSLIVGAGGFIGRHVAGRLIAQGRPVIAAGRDPARLARLLPGARSIACDLTRDDADRWAERLVGVEALINCAGVLGGDYAVHDRGARALFAGARRAGVGRIIQISALGAQATGGTPYQRSKHAADACLADLAGDGAKMGWAVLRPSLVLGRGGASTAFLSAVAALPVVPLLGPMGQVQPILVEDLVEAVVRLLDARLPLALRIDGVGPEPMAIDTVVAHLRDWLGLAPARRLAVPGWMIRGAAWLGIGPLTGEALTMLKAGNTASPDPFVAALGFRPRGVKQGLACHPAARGDRMTARMMPWAPVLRWLLALVWLLGGGVALLLTPGMQASAWLARAGLVGGAAKVALWGGALADLGVGLALLLPWRGVAWPGVSAAGAMRKGAIWAGVLLMAAYTAILTLIAPALWTDPFGPLVKNVAVLGLSLAVWAVESCRD